MLVLDPSHLGFLMSLQSFGQLESMMLVSATVCPDSPLLVLDHAYPDLLSLVRSYAQLGLALPALDCSALDLPLSLHSYACLGAASPVFSVTNPDFLFPVFDLATMGLPMFSAKHGMS